MNNTSCHNSISSLASGGGNGADPDQQYIPSNKESAWVYPKGSDVTKDKSKTHQGVWQSSKFSLASSLKKFAKRKDPDASTAEGEELWIFRDDDPHGIDPRVLENNPVKGKWGYAPAVKKKKRGDKIIILQKSIDPLDMWFYPPNTKEGDIPKNCTIMGEWIKPEQSKSAAETESSAQGGRWNLRRKINPGGKKKENTSIEVPEAPKKNKPTKLENPKTEEDTVMKTSRSSTIKRKKSLTDKEAEVLTSPKTQTKQPKPPKPSSMTPVKPSMSSNTSFSSIKTPTCSPQKKPAGLPPNSPSSLQSSMSSMTSSKRSLGSDDFQITIRRQPTLETFPLVVQPSYKISQIKQKINRFRGIPLDDIKLSHKDKSLDKVGPRDTLNSLGIRNRDVIDMAGFTIYIRTLKGKKYVLSNVDVELPIDTLRQIAADKDKSPLEKIGLYFNRQVLQNGTALPKYKVRAKSVIELKYDGAGIPAAEQKVYTRRENVPRKRVGPSTEPPKRKPSVTLKKPVEPPAEILQINIIPAEAEKPKVTVVLAPLDDVDDLLRKSAKKVGSPQSHFALMRENGDKITSETYKIVNGDTLHVVPVATVQLPDNSFVKKLIFPGENTFADLQRMLQGTTDVPVKYQILLDENGKVLKASDSISLNKTITLQVKKPTKTITIRDPDDELHEIILEADETSTDLWKRVAEVVKMPLDELCLADDATEEELECEEYSPADGDFLVVIVPPSSITVTLPNGDKFELEVMPTATIGELKEVLEEETGTDRDQHRLFYLASNDELTDDTLLSEDVDLRLELKAGSQKDIEENIKEETIRVTVTKLDGKVVDVEFDPELSAMEVRTAISEQTGIPIRELKLSKDGVEELKKGYIPTNGDAMKVLPSRITVKTPEGDNFSIDFHPTDSGKLIREKIAQKAGVPSSELFLMKGDKEIDISYVPSDGDELRTKPRRITVTGIDGTVMQVTLSTGDTLNSIQRKISQEMDVPLKDVVLSRGDERLEADYIPSSGDILKIVPPTISVKMPDGSAMILPAKQKMTVGTVKDSVEERQDIKRTQILVFDSDKNELNDDIPVCRDSDLTVKIKKNTITIVARDESTFDVDLDFDSTVHSLREMVSRKSGIATNELRLSIDGDELSSDYVPSNGDIITVDPPTVTVLLPDGEMLELAASHDTTLADIKEVLAEETGVHVQAQKICLEGTHETLSDEMSITKDMQIRMVIQELLLEKEPITVVIETPDEKRHSIEVLPDDSFVEFRRKAARALGLPFKDLRLSKDDEEVGKEFLPSKGDILYLMSPTVTVELPDNEQLELEALPDTTIGDIKDALEEETGIKKEKHFIFLAGTSDSTPLTDDVGITKDISVVLEKSTSVTLNHFDGKNIPLEIEPRSDLKSLKSKIASILGVQVKSLRLANHKDDLKTAKFSEGEIIEVLPPRVYVQFPDGSRNEFDVKPNQSIAELKSIIKKKTGMPNESQQIFFLQKDQEIDDDTLFSRSDFIDGTALEVRFEKPQIVVQMPNGRKLDVELEFSDTKNDVRFKVAREIGGGILAQDLRLLLDGKEIDKKYKPRKGQVLTVHAHLVKVEMPDGSRISISVMPNQTVADVKDAIEQLTDVPMDSLQVFVSGSENELEDGAPVSRYDFDNSTILQVCSPYGSPGIDVHLPGGKSFQLILDSEKTLPEISEMIEEQFGLPIGGVNFNGELLDVPDEIPLATFLGSRLRSGSVLQVRPPELRVELPDREGLCLNVLPSMTVADLKDQIQILHPDLIINDFVFASMTGTDTIDDRSSVKNLDLTSGVRLLEKLKDIEVTIQSHTGDFFPIKITPTDDTEMVKEKVYEVTKVSPEHQHLTINGASLKDGMSLKDQGLGKGAVLSLRPMQVRVILPDRSQLDLCVKPDFDFQKLKDLIAKETSIPVVDQILSFEGETMKDRVLLSESDVCHGDMITLEKFTVNILCWSGDLIELDEIGSEDTIQKVMDKIFELKSVPSEKQKISKSGQELIKTTTKSLKDLGIKHKETLMLENPDKLDISSKPSKKSKPAFSFFKKATNLLSGSKVHSLEKSGPVTEESSKNANLEGESSGPVTEESSKNVNPECENSSSDEDSSSSEEEKGSIPELSTITVVTPDLRPITVELGKEDSAKDVREKIATKVGIQTDELRLSKHGDESLVDEDYIPSAGDILTIEPPTIEIFTSDGAQYELSAMSDTTIMDVKEYLHDQTGIAIEFQQLFLAVDMGSELSNDTPIRTDTILKLMTAQIGENQNEEDPEEEPPALSVTLPDGKIVSIEIDDSDLPRDVRKKIAKKVGVAVKHLRLAKDGRIVDKKFLPAPGDELSVLPPDLCISLPDGSKLTLPATPSTTLDDVKDFLAKETGTKTEDQELYSVGVNGMELVTAIPRSMDDVDLKLKIISKKRPSLIAVKTPDGESFTIEVQEADTAKDVRKKIAKRAGLTTRGLRLTMKGLEVDAKYLPTNGDVFAIEPPVVVIEFMDGETMELEAMPGTTIDDIKDILEEETEIPKANQKLVSMELNGKEWENDRSITNDMRFRLIEFEEEGLYDEITVDEASSEEDDDSISFDNEKGRETGQTDNGSPLGSHRNKVGSMEIHVHDQKRGYNHTFSFKPETTIDQVQSKIPYHARVADNFDDQVLTHKGKALDNSKTLDECGIINGDVLTLERYMVNISHFMVEVLPFEDVSCHDTVGALKAKLAKQQSLAKDQQLLTVQGVGTVLDNNNKTLKQCGIVHGTVLVLQEDLRSPTTRGKVAVDTSTSTDSGNLDDRLAKIKERAEARKRAKAASKK